MSTANFKQIKREIAAQLSGRPIKLIFYNNKKCQIGLLMKSAVAHLIITIYDVKVQRYWSHCAQAGL